MRKGRASRTAMMVAYWRALADSGVTNVPNFSDPFARRTLSGPWGRFMLRMADKTAASPREKTARLRDHVDGIVLRVAFIDAVIAEESAKQVVILGAGLDTRAWRLSALRGARVFEVDHPDTQAYKRERAPALGEPLADVRYVPMDFTRDDLGRALREAGHDAAAPTVWVWEGVIMYLADDALRSTLRAVRSLSAPGSALIAHYHEPESGRLNLLIRKALFAWLGEPQVGMRTREVMRDEVTRAGFSLVEDAGLPEQGARIGAPVSANERLRVSRILVAKVLPAGSI